MDIAGALSGKMGPLPTWAWIAAGGGAIGAVGLMLKSRKAASSAQSAPIAINPFAFGNPSTDSGGTTANPTPIITPIVTPTTPGPTDTGPQSSPMQFPSCALAPAGQYCIESYTEIAPGIAVGASRPDIVQHQAGSPLWETLARDWSYQIGMMPGFQLQPGGIRYFGSPAGLPAGTPYYGWPGVSAPAPNQQR